MDPINYQINVKSPMEATLQGFQGGLAIKQALQQQALQQQALQQQQQMQADLANLASNPNAGAKDYAGMMTKYPQLADHFKKSWDVLSADQQQAKLSHSVQVYSALQAGKPEIAVDLLNRQAEGFRNSGQQDDAEAARHHRG